MFISNLFASLISWHFKIVQSDIWYLKARFKKTVPTTIWKLVIDGLEIHQQPIRVDGNDGNDDNDAALKSHFKSSEAPTKGERGLSKFATRQLANEFRNK